MSHSSTIVRSNEVIGVAVKNSHKESLGKIEEIVINKSSGQVCYVVLSFGGLLGMGEKYFAFPWKSISFSKEDTCFILNVDKERLKNAPGFDTDKWPNMVHEAWQQSIDNYYRQDEQVV